MATVCVRLVPLDDALDRHLKCLYQSKREDGGGYEHAAFNGVDGRARAPARSASSACAPFRTQDHESVEQDCVQGSAVQHQVDDAGVVKQISKPRRIHVPGSVRTRPLFAQNCSSIRWTAIATWLRVVQRRAASRMNSSFHAAAMCGSRRARRYSSHRRIE